MRKVEEKLEEEYLRILSKYMDPVLYEQEMKDTQRRLKAAKTPKDIALCVVLPLRGIGTINSTTVSRYDFRDAMRRLAPQLKVTTDEALRQKIHEYITAHEWERLESREEQERCRSGTLNQQRQGYTITFYPEQAESMPFILKMLKSLGDVVIQKLLHGVCQLLIAALGTIPHSLWALIALPLASEVSPRTGKERA